MTGAWSIRFIPMGGAKFTKVTRVTHGELVPATRCGTAGGEGSRVWGCRKMRWRDRNLGVVAPVTVTPRGAVKAGLVFLFMAFLAAQAATGFMRDLFAGGVYPRAMRAFDWILSTFFTDPLGQAGGAFALLLLGAVFAALVLRREARLKDGEYK